jgi:hypothetical protein
VGRDIALLFHDRGTRRGCVILGQLDKEMYNNVALNV